VNEGYTQYNLYVVRNGTCLIEDLDSLLVLSQSAVALPVTSDQIFAALLGRKQKSIKV
jgi:hypothetical protein